VDNSALNGDFTVKKNPEGYDMKCQATLVSLHSLTPHPGVGSE